MSSENILYKVKKLREITGVGFKDCKIAIDESNGDVEKAIEFLRKKGIAKVNKKMERVASDGLISIFEKDNSFSILEVNSETDFVAKNSEFINFVEKVSELVFTASGDIKNVPDLDMENKKKVKDNLISLISKIGEKITIRRCDMIKSNNFINFSYIHSAIKKNVGKIGVLLSLEVTNKSEEVLKFGKDLTMHIAATSPLAIDKEGLDQNLLNKEKEIITEELKNSGKDSNIIDKITIGKLNKFISDNTLLNQEWIKEPKKKVKDIIKEASQNNKIKIKKFIRFKVGEGV